MLVRYTSGAGESAQGGSAGGSAQRRSEEGVRRRSAGAGGRAREEEGEAVEGDLRRGVDRAPAVAEDAGDEVALAPRREVPAGRRAVVTEGEGVDEGDWVTARLRGVPEGDPMVEDDSARGAEGVVRVGPLLPLPPDEGKSTVLARAMGVVWAARAALPGDLARRVESFGEDEGAPTRLAPVEQPTCSVSHPPAECSAAPSPDSPVSVPSWCEATDCSGRWRGMSDGRLLPGADGERASEAETGMAEAVRGRGSARRDEGDEDVGVDGGSALKAGWDRFECSCRATERLRVEPAV